MLPNVTKRQKVPLKDDLGSTRAVTWANRCDTTHLAQSQRIGLGPADCRRLRANQPQRTSKLITGNTTDLV